MPVSRDAGFMRLGRTFRGHTAPNPAVGAVVVARGRVVGRGAHAGAGKPHAEVLALAEAGAAARGATLYVTLEPCAHYGQTPPCAAAVVAAGVRRVVVGTLDPGPKVSGRGAAALARVGVELTVGVHERACRHLIEDFATAVVRDRPWVTAKFAVTLDGKIATRTGDAAWVSGAAARDVAHGLRWEHDAVLVGRGTVYADDPRLTARLAGRDAREGPVRVIVATRGELPPDARVFTEAPAPSLWVACTRRAGAAAVKRLTRRGAEVIMCAEDGGGVSLEDLLCRLRRRNVHSVLVEGGAALLGAFFDHGLIDGVSAFVAPKLFGGRRAPSAVAGKGVAWAADAPALRETTWRRLGADMYCRGYLADVDTLFAALEARTRALKGAPAGRDA